MFTPVVELRNPQVVILAAGIGTRLGLSSPKPLTALADGQTIMQRQLRHLEAAFPQAQVMVVIGHKPDLIMRAVPHVLFAYNHRFERTNTSKSLLLALRLSVPGGVLWLNGDVVFECGLLERIHPMIKADESFVCVNTAAIGDEEITYTLDRDGYILRLAKAIIGGLGEAVGINYVASSDKTLLIEHLERCADQDYFERGIEFAIETAGMRVRALDISDFSVVEVDFPVDLERANSEVCKTIRRR
ncbi:MAG TPA: NTP transferase domain-containing protein [Pseudonocardiaceae bacterium]|nr:NTP transferase domain-containing protein [Pseudonocardiaceae bacterium]